MVGMGKGVAEKNIEASLKKLLAKHPRLAKMKGMGSMPWGASRGLTSALAGIPYTISAVIAAREFGKGRDKKKKS
jgi:hypothetical protein